MTTRTVPAADGTRLHVREGGNPAGPPLVLLHGIGQSGLAWRALDTSPLGDRFRLVAVDLRGHGRSAVPADPDTLLDGATWGGDVQAVVDALGLSAPVVVGWSYGGVVALDHLAAHPGVARAIVLVGAPPGAGFPDAGPWFDPGFLALAPGLVSSDATTYVAAQRALVERCTATPPPPEVAAALLGEAVLTAPSTIAGVLRRRVDARPALAASSVPVLVVTGVRDRVITGAAAEAVLAARPDARVVGLDTGHTPFLEDPDGFAAAVLEFLDHRRAPVGPA